MSRDINDPRVVEVMRILEQALALGAVDFHAGTTIANRLVFETVCADHTWSPDAFRAVLLAMVQHMPEADLAIVIGQPHDEASYLAKYAPGGEWSQDLEEHRA